MEKSELISVGNISNVENLADELGCKVGCLPSTYLRLPLGARFRSTVVWDGVEEKIGNVEEAVYFERWESYFDKEYAVNYTNILHVLFYAKNGEIKARPD